MSRVDLAPPPLGPRAVVIAKIRSLADECGTPGWDGDEAEPLSLAATERAVDLIRALPDDVPLPEIAPEPDGCISLDWIRSCNRVISVSIEKSARLAYAWLDGVDNGHAVALFDGQTAPSGILDRIARLLSGPSDRAS